METTTAKSYTTATLSTQFDLHTRLFNNVLDEISDVEANDRASDTVNHIKWLAGHLTATRYGMTKIGGNEQENPYGELFGHGKGISNEAEYPGIAEIKEKWNAISSDISAGLSNMPGEALNGPAPTQTPVNDETLGGFLSFLMHHEAYHLGQMGILRKYLGKDAMSYS